MTQLPSLDSRINAFIKLGKVIGLASKSVESGDPSVLEDFQPLHQALVSAGIHNKWFTRLNIVRALNAWASALEENPVYSWVKSYEDKIVSHEPKRVAVIMAGNIPLVGFHDFLSTIISGNHFFGKLSSDDKILLPALADLLVNFEPELKQMIRFVDGPNKEFDAIIATGSNNTARYFEYYFSNRPNIIRKNRNSIAVLSGTENEEQLAKLGSDICTYFGFGCRNVSKVMIPSGFDPARLFEAITPYAIEMADHYKYMNNYNYYRSIYLLNKTQHLDNGFIMLKESDQYPSPIPVIFYQYYNNIELLRQKIHSEKELLQCIASDVFESEITVPLGTTQSPGLGDYADGIDTMKFLTEI